MGFLYLMPAMNRHSPPSPHGQLCSPLLLLEAQELDPSASPRIPVPRADVLGGLKLKKWPGRFKPTPDLFTSQLLEAFKEHCQPIWQIHPVRSTDTFWPPNRHRIGTQPEK